MITIVEGNPGSGKSYFGVSYLLKYCTYDSMFQEHVIREDVLIISNVENLKIKHLSLEDLIKKYTVEAFFTVENFEKIQKQYKVKNIILIIDEAQKIFDSKFYNKDVFYFFQYHRHLGVDIMLLTQSRSTIARQLIPLTEYIVAAKPRSKGIGGTFSYNYLDPKGNYMFNKTLRVKQDVFRAYKSMNVDEMNKPKNVLKVYVLMFSVVAIAVYFLFKSFFAWFKYDTKNVVKNNKPAITSMVTPNDAVAADIPKTNVQQPAIPADSASPPESKLSALPSIPPLPDPGPVSHKSEWVPLDLVSKQDGVDGHVIVSLKGYKGVFRLPCEVIKRVDLKNMVAIVDRDKLVPE